MPASSIAVQKPEKAENLSAFLIAYVSIIKKAKTANTIRNNFEFSNILKAAPEFVTYIKSKTGF